MAENQSARKWSIAEIRKLFSMEFGVLEERVRFFEVEPPANWLKTGDDAARPGVYVYWHDGRVVKVGRSLTNARKRAYQHIQHDTQGKMKVLENDPNARILLFTVSLEDCRWAAAFEIFLEDRLHPAIPTQRRG